MFVENKVNPPVNLSVSRLEPINVADSLSELALNKASTSNGSLLERVGTQLISDDLIIADDSGGEWVAVDNLLGVLGTLTGVTPGTGYVYNLLRRDGLAGASAEPVFEKGRNRTKPQVRIDGGVKALVRELRRRKRLPPEGAVPCLDFYQQEFALSGEEAQSIHQQLLLLPKVNGQFFSVIVRVNRDALAEDRKDTKTYVTDSQSIRLAVSSLLNNPPRSMDIFRLSQKMEISVYAFLTVLKALETPKESQPELSDLLAENTGGVPCIKEKHISFFIDQLDKGSFLPPKQSISLQEFIQTDSLGFPDGWDHMAVYEFCLQVVDQLEEREIIKTIIGFDDEVEALIVYVLNPKQLLNLLQNEGFIASLKKDPETEMDVDLSNIDTDDGVGLYLKEISRYPLLTVEEEGGLSMLIQAGINAHKILARDVDNKAEETRLKVVEKKGKTAESSLAKANLRLVVSVAKKYCGRGVLFLDLIQEGNIGLTKAVKKFDHSLGYKFSTYASWWIRQAVTRAIAEQARTIRVSVHMHVQIGRLARASRQLMQTLGRDPTMEEIAQELEVDSEKVKEIVKASSRPLSLDMLVGEEEDSFLGEFIPDDSQEPLLDQVAQLLLREQIDTILETLTPREELIVKMRFGLTDGHSHTLEEVGRKFGVTRERIRQIEAEVMQCLRDPRVLQSLRDFLPK